MSSTPESTILLVDDDADMRASVSYDLREFGALVVEAGDGEEALRRMEERPMDLVISDIRMPRKNGLELLDAIRATYGDRPPVLFMSGFADIPLWDAYDRGVEAFLGKPFDVDDMLARIRRALAPRRSAWTDDPGDVKARIALPSRQNVRVGRGGLFLPAFPANGRAGDVVAFDIGSSEGGPGLSGKGILRWLQTASGQRCAAGCGIELLYVEPHAREALCAEIDAAKPVPFIPRGLR